jgi:hypothetical protein
MSTTHGRKMSSFSLWIINAGNLLYVIVLKIVEIDFLAIDMTGAKQPRLPHKHGGYRVKIVQLSHVSLSRHDTNQARKLTIWIRV